MPEEVAHISIRPNYTDLRWEVWLDESLIGRTKASCDADFYAERLAKFFDPSLIVNHAPDERRTIMAEFERLKKDKKGKA